MQRHPNRALKNPKAHSEEVLPFSNPLQLPESVHLWLAGFRVPVTSTPPLHCSSGPLFPSAFTDSGAHSVLGTCVPGPTLGAGNPAVNP